MKDENKVPQREIRPFNQADVDRATELVGQALGDDYGIEYAELPRNVGTAGDVGVRGDTVMITSGAERPAVAFTERIKELGQVSTQLANETTAAKVLIDITSPDASPTFLKEGHEKDAKAIPFEDIVKRRLEGHVLLKRRFYDRLEGDPMLQVAVSAILDVKNLDLRANIARQMAEELRAKKQEAE